LRIEGTKRSRMMKRGDGRGLMAGMRRWWLLVPLLAAMGGATAYLGSGEIESVYQATTTLLVGDVTEAPNLTKSDIEASDSLAETYGRLLRSQPVLGSVTQELGLQMPWEELKDRVHVDLGANEIPLIIISVSASSPAEARTIAAAIADRIVAISPSGTGRSDEDDSHAFASRQARELERTIGREEQRISRLETALAAASTPQERGRIQSEIREHVDLVIDLQGNYTSLVQLASAGGSPNSLQVLQPAQAGTAPIRPDVEVITALGAALGALAGIAIAYGLRVRRGHGIRHVIYQTGDGAIPVVALDPWVRELTDPDQEAG
jgi:uncharacterized protein involved in exopolysaccharide biosynthesis